MLPLGTSHSLSSSTLDPDPRAHRHPVRHSIAGSDTRGDRSFLPPSQPTPSLLAIVFTAGTTTNGLGTFYYIRSSLHPTDAPMSPIFRLSRYRQLQPSVHVSHFTCACSLLKEREEAKILSVRIAAGFPAPCSPHPVRPPRLGPPYCWPRSGRGLGQHTVLTLTRIIYDNHQPAPSQSPYTSIFWGGSIDVVLPLRCRRGKKKKKLRPQRRMGLLRKALKKKAVRFYSRRPSVDASLKGYHPPGLAVLWRGGGIFNHATKARQGSRGGCGNMPGEKIGTQGQGKFPDGG